MNDTRIKNILNQHWSFSKEVVEKATSLAKEREILTEKEIEYLLSQKQDTTARDQRYKEIEKKKKKDTIKYMAIILLVVLLWFLRGFLRSS